MSDQILKFLQQENQRLLEENSLLREEVLTLRGYLAGVRSLQRAAEVITAEEDPNVLLDKILYSALTVIDAAAGSVLLLDPTTNELVFIVVHGGLGSTLLGHRVPAGLGIAGWVAMQKEPLIVNNVRADHRFYSGVDEVYEFETEALLCVPMMSGKVLGVIEVLNKHTQQGFSETDLDLLNTLAHIATTTIDRLESEQTSLALQKAS